MVSLPSYSPLRIFAISLFATLAALVVTFISDGIGAMLLVGVLIIIEITFSFDNAIINARILDTMSPFWQRIFMTLGILVAVFGMRLVFPIVVVMMTAGLSWHEVISLALHNPEGYAHELERSHASISAFGGMFLLMLALHFFFDSSRSIHWLKVVEIPLQRVGRWWLGAGVSAVVLAIILLLPLPVDKTTVLTAGVFGILTYLGVHGLSELFSNVDKNTKSATGERILKTGMAGLMAFLYLEVLDASFSFDGVIGAFAVTQDVVLIALGLGIGALWVRSLTLFMVRRRTLQTYRYLEHGAHYTIAALATVMLTELFVSLPAALPGLLGIGIIAISIIQSIHVAHSDQPQST